MPEHSLKIPPDLPFLHPRHRSLAERILGILQKRMPQKLMGYLYPEKIMQVFQAVDLKKTEGSRDYCLLHLLFDSGARASEIATLNLDCFDGWTPFQPRPRRHRREMGEVNPGEND